MGGGSRRSSVARTARRAMSYAVAIGVIIHDHKQVDDNRLDGTFVLPDNCREIKIYGLLPCFGWCWTLNRKQQLSPIIVFWNLYFIPLLGNDVGVIPLKSTTDQADQGDPLEVTA